MPAEINSIAELIRNSFVELKFVIGTCANSEAEAENMSQEAERVVVSMIAMIAVEDRKLDEREAQLLVSLLQFDHLPGGVVRYVNEYASRWPILSKNVPSFYLAAIRNQPHHDSYSATQIRCLLQQIANNVASVDDRPGHHENAVVRKYLRFLEGQLPPST